ncbi:MAG: alkaline phosphatase family protein [archaeon]
MSKRIMIIGLDGMPYRLMKKLSDDGTMPNFKKLRESSNSTFTKMQSSIPEISSVAWSSIITGKNPAEHGIYGFTEIIPGTYTLSFPNFKNLKEKPFWHQDMDKRSIIINVPSTYPAAELNGFLVSGFVALDLERAVYPPEYAEDLEKMGYKIDVDSEKGHTSKDAFFKDLNETVENRMKLFRKLWEEKKDWDNFMFVFTGTDRLGHFLWKAFDDESHKYHKQFIEHFAMLDKFIGEMTEKLREDDALIMLSDHGIESIKQNVYVNAVLRKNGFLELKENEEGKRVNYNSISSESDAFCLDPGRIYLHKIKKYPNGSVEPGDEEKLVEQLTKLFEGLEFEGEKVIKKVFRNEDIYTGPYRDKAPDLVLLANPGFNLRGNIAKEELFEEDIFEGKHTQDDAFLLVKTEKRDVVPNDVTVSDIVGIMKKIQGE